MIFQANIFYGIKSLDKKEFNYIKNISLQKIERKYFPGIINNIDYFLTTVALLE